jgi:hypothetical protein
MAATRRFFNKQMARLGELNLVRDAMNRQLAFNLQVHHWAFVSHSFDLKRERGNFSTSKKSALFK